MWHFITKMTVPFKIRQLKWGSVLWFFLQELLLFIMKNTFWKVHRNSPNSISEPILCSFTGMHTHTKKKKIISYFLGNGRISTKLMEYTPTNNSTEQHAEGRCLGSGRRHWRFIWSREKCNPSVLYPGQLLSTMAEKNSSFSADSILKWKWPLYLQ